MTASVSKRPLAIGAVVVGTHLWWWLSVVQGACADVPRLGVWCGWW